MGPLMLDLHGCELDAEEKELLDHPGVGGVILFSRNYPDPQQLAVLVAAIREHGRQPLLLGVDHEGGRVQRFRDGFTRIPPMGALARLTSAETRSRLAKTCGWLMAAELLAMDIDVSFAPVLDLERGSEVIGDRSFHDDPDMVVELAGAFIDGMHEAGMKATGKHFPGHGSVRADSHKESPRDARSLAELEQADLRPFRRLIEAGKLDAIMPAHVIYSAIDAQPAGFSPFWLKQVLRRQLGFQGVIFSDDLTMEGAAVAGGYPERARAALAAGCDMLLACNHRAGAVAILDSLPALPPCAALALRKGACGSRRQLEASSRWREARRWLEHLTHS